MFFGVEGLIGDAGVGEGERVRADEEVHVKVKIPCLSSFIGQVMDDDGLITMRELRLNLAHSAPNCVSALT